MEFLVNEIFSSLVLYKTFQEIFSAMVYNKIVNQTWMKKFAADFLRDIESLCEEQMVTDKNFSKDKVLFY